jgi:hypothetical protein
MTKCKHRKFQICQVFKFKLKTTKMKTKTKRKTIPESGRFYMMIILISIFNSLSYSQSGIKDNTEQIVQGIPCKGEVKYFENNKINTCFIAKDYTIEDYLLPAGSSLTFNSDGTISDCRISKETKFFGQILPAKTVVFFNHWGEKLSFWLPENTNIQGHLVRASNNGPGEPLYQNGNLKEIWLVNDEIIDGVPCSTSGNIFLYGWHIISFGTNRRVRFYDNGHLQRAMLSKDIVIQGHSYKMGEFIFLDKEGKIDLNTENQTLN